MGGKRGSQENDSMHWTPSKASVIRLALRNTMEDMRKKDY